MSCRIISDKGKKTRHRRRRDPIEGLTSPAGYACGSGTDASRPGLSVPPPWPLSNVEGSRSLVAGVRNDDVREDRCALSVATVDRG